jgi:superfamily I DNA/RNA helicase
MDPGDDDDSAGNATPVFSGPKPRWLEAPAATHGHLVCDEIESLRGGPSPVNLGQIAVIVREGGQAARFVAEFQNRGVAARQVAKGAPLRIDGAEVHVITAHSSKGLGFPIVFVPLVNGSNYPWRNLMDKARDSEQRLQVEENEQRLLYVALSRASHRLFMIADPEAPSPFLHKLDRGAHWR